MKRNMKLIGLAACLISCTSLAVAQENPGTTGKTAT